MKKRAHFKKELIGIGLILIVASCSSTYRKPESFEDKMARYKATETNKNKVPEFMVANARFKKPSVRAPASVDTLGNEENRQHSNKRLYFLTLLSQYNSLKRYGHTSNAPQVKFCPSFHTSLVDHKAAYSGHKMGGQIKLSFKDRYPDFSEHTVALYPELSLPVSEESTRPTVADILGNQNYTGELADTEKVFQRALEIHLKKTYTELQELCEFGTSDNYYTYENLITFIKRHKKFMASKESMKTLFRTTLFSNMALISSLEGDRPKGGRGIASVDGAKSYNHVVIRRLGVDWAGGYFNEMKKLRKK